MRHIVYTLTATLVMALTASITANADNNSRKAYLQWMQEELPECPEFDAWQKSTGELPPDFDKMPGTNLLPDPFVYYNGKTVGRTAEEWNKRRQEILDLFIKYEFGTLPPKPQINKVEVMEETKGNGYVSRTVKLWFGPKSAGSVRCSLTIPTGNPGQKYPVLIGTSLGGPGNSVLRRGYISAGFAGSDFMDDGAALTEIYPKYTFSTITRRAWLVSIVLDYFATVPEVDMDRIAIFGYSRDGKMAAIAAALDERISCLIAGSTGVGGFVPWRYSGERGGGEGIESTTRMFPTWFIPSLRFFSGREDKLPVDANLLLALIAPRAVLMEWGDNDEVANGWAQERVYDSALPVYQRFGAEDRLSLIHVPGFHGSNDMSACIDFMDIQFGKSGRKWSYQPVFTWNYKYWKRNYGENSKVISLPRINLRGNRQQQAIAKSLNAWESGKEKLIGSIKSMLGKTPLTMESAGRSGGFFFGGGGFSNPGPIEVLDGKFNAGQLKPDVPAWVVRRKSAEFGWTAADAEGVASKRITIGPDSVTGDLFFPEGTPAGTKLPTVIWLHGYNFPLGYMWVYRRDVHPILALVKEGYAVLAFDQTGFGQRFGEYATFYDRYPEWSRLGKMVEDVQSAVTALEKDAIVDASEISLYGYTLGGTVGLYTAALDSRIKNVISVCGFTPMRTDTASNGLTGLTRYGELYGLAPKISEFAGQENRLPYDYDELIALAAPKGVLIVQPGMDRDADVEGVRNAVARASEVFGWMNAGDQLKLQEPDDIARLTNKTQSKIIDWLKSHTK